MASKDLELKLRITADGKVAVDQLGNVSTALSSIDDEARGASGGLDEFVSKGAVFGKLALGFNEVQEALGRIGAAASDMIEMAEAVKALEARLGLAVEGFGDAGQAMDDVRRIANDTGASLESVGELHTKTAGAAKSLGISQQQVATVTETVSRAMRVAGASGAAAEGALTQFSQALASGVLRGEEFNSAYEAAPYLIDQLAQGLGVATEDMRALAKAGELSARQVAAALEKQSADISAAYAQLPQTVGQAMQRVRNELALYVGGLNDSLGAIEAMSAVLGTLAEHIDLIGPARRAQ
jgi:tape measure domain-containing protein